MSCGEEQLTVKARGIWPRAERPPLDRLEREPTARRPPVARPARPSEKTPNGARSVPCFPSDFRFKRLAASDSPAIPHYPKDWASGRPHGAGLVCVAVWRRAAPGSPAPARERRAPITRRRLMSTTSSFSLFFLCSTYSPPTSGSPAEASPSPTTAQGALCSLSRAFPEEEPKKKERRESGRGPSPPLFRARLDRP